MTNHQDTAPAPVDQALYAIMQNDYVLNRYLELNLLDIDGIRAVANFMDPDLTSSSTWNRIAAINPPIPYLIVGDGVSAFGIILELPSGIRVFRSILGYSPHPMSHELRTFVEWMDKQGSRLTLIGPATP